MCARYDMPIEHLFFLLHSCMYTPFETSASVTNTFYVGICAMSVFDGIRDDMSQAGIPKRSYTSVNNFGRRFDITS